jgi:hypothetical protein
MSERVFRDRRDAGRVLAGVPGITSAAMMSWCWGLPREGVPVAYEVATALDAPLDIFVVRKLGVPGHEELALGAVASDGVIVLNDDVATGFGITSDAIREVAEREGRELARREQAYRNGRPMPDLSGRPSFSSMMAWRPDHPCKPLCWRCAACSRSASWWPCRRRRVRPANSSGSRSTRSCALPPRRHSSPWVSPTKPMTVPG